MGKSVCVSSARTLWTPTSPSRSTDQAVRNKHARTLIYVHICMPTHAFVWHVMYCNFCTAHTKDFTWQEGTNKKNKKRLNELNILRQCFFFFKWGPRSPFTSFVFWSCHRLIEQARFCFHISTKSNDDKQITQCKCSSTADNWNTFSQESVFQISKIKKTCYLFWTGMQICDAEKKKYVTNLQ